MPAERLGASGRGGEKCWGALRETCESRGSRRSFPRQKPGEARVVVACWGAVWVLCQEAADDRGGPKVCLFRGLLPLKYLWWQRHVQLFHDSRPTHRRFSL